MEKITVPRSVGHGSGLGPGADAVITARSGWVAARANDTDAASMPPEQQQRHIDAVEASTRVAP
jgi:hypothetical protein